MIISHIVAVARGGVIGKDGVMPWHVEGELRRFRELTMGNYVLMGRRTYQHLPRPLEGRKLIVLSRSMAPKEGVLVARSIAQALDLAAAGPELFIAGGAEVYRNTIDLIDRLYLTRIELDVVGDTWYPLDRIASYRRVYCETFHSNATYSYETYLTRPSA